MPSVEIIALVEGEVYNHRRQKKTDLPRVQCMAYVIVVYQNLILYSINIHVSLAYRKYLAPYWLPQFFTINELSFQ